MFNYFYICTLKLRIIIILYSILALFSCQNKNNHDFYYWRTNYKLSNFEQKTLNSWQTKKLYVRFFDIDRQNNTPFPVATIQIHEKNTTQEIIPVVFITNKTFKNNSKNEIKRLANHTYNEIIYLYSSISNRKIKEIQFDCDWTAQTMKNYFFFLETIQQIDQHILVSATIRLHQIKDKRTTGIPPIKKGILMYYATSNPLENSSTNSILDNKLADNYIQNISQYPIDLDVALPIYSWAIVSNELGEKRLINGITDEDLKDENIYKKLNKNNYQVKKEHYLNSIFVYENYEIEIERISENDLKKAANNIRKRMKNKDYRIVYYHLDENNLQNYSLKTLKKL